MRVRRTLPALAGRRATGPCTLDACDRPVGRPDPAGDDRVTDPEAPEIDTELLRGFRFDCRPDCGLCCYAEPRVEAAERTAIVRILPEAEFKTAGRDVFLASRPGGGACQFLEGHRCRAHAVRPRPCREYPLSVHVGRRLQATVVLSCPGVELGALTRRDPTRLLPPEGLASELASLDARRDGRTARRLAETARRGRRVERALSEEGRWEPDETVRRNLDHPLPLPGPADFPVEEPPDRGEGMSNLPLFFDGRPGPVAIASGLGGWELLQLAPSGAVRTEELVVPPDRPPGLTEDARSLLEAYLRYWLRRDAFLASVQLEMLDGTEGAVTAWAERDLRALGATTLARASVRAKRAGRDGDHLTEADVTAGIRATDQDALDRPTWGDRF
jgi:Fe-S-cluster containining protein